MATRKIIVIKVGTDVLGNAEPFNVIARQIAELKKKGFGALLVSSGGVGAGSARITVLGGKPEDYSNRFRAGIGARHLLNQWGDALALNGCDVIQFYVTYGNLRLRGERESVRSGLRRLAFDRFIIPLLNENDVVSAVEIAKMKKGFGDNDRLARVVACLVQASAIAFVTVKGGVYTANPDTDSSARLLKRIGASRRFRPGKSVKCLGTSKNGTGGITSKVNQASICARRKMRAGIIGFREIEITKFFSGEDVGTLLVV